MYEIIKKRRSVRVFLPNAISRENLNKILDAGRLAPSANNLQQWEFIVIDNKDLRLTLSDLCQWGRFIKTAPVTIAVFGDRQNLSTPLDCAAATENMIIMACALNIASCWVAGYRKPHSEPIRKLLSVPQNYELVSLIALGYSDADVKMPDKRSLESVTHFNKF